MKRSTARTFRTEKELKDNTIAILCIVSVPLLNIIYTFSNRRIDAAYTLVTFVDNKVPFIKYFILPYNLWYPFLLSSLFYLCIKDRKTFYRGVAAIDIGLLCCYMIYMLFQTTVPRPLLVESDIFTRIVGFTYKMDRPYNCMPSIHVLTIYIVMKGYNKSKITSKSVKAFIYAIGSLIILSTLFVKQHVIIDIAAALVLGDIVLYLIGNLNISMKIRLKP